MEHGMHCPNCRYAYSYATGKSKRKLINGARKVRKNNYVKIPKWLIIIIAAYMLSCLYNGFMVDKAFKEINFYSNLEVGRDVLIDKGIFGHTLYYLSHPSIHFKEISRDHETRMAYLLVEVRNAYQ